MKEFTVDNWHFTHISSTNLCVVVMYDTLSNSPGYYDKTYRPLEELDFFGFKLPYPDPFEPLTAKEAVFQNSLSDLRKVYGTQKLKCVIQDANDYGPIYIEEFVDNDKIKNMIIEHHWKKISDEVGIKYTIEVSYEVIN